MGLFCGAQHTARTWMERLVLGAQQLWSARRPRLGQRHMVWPVPVHGIDQVDERLAVNTAACSSKTERSAAGGGQRGQLR